MKYVYTVRAGYGDQEDCLLDVYSSRKKAEIYIDKHPEDKNYLHIRKMELQ